MMSGSVKLLVVDDSAVVRRALRERLEKDPFFESVDTASDGPVALRKIERLDPDVVTMDIQMPGMDGLETLRRIMRRFPRPVIMLSAYTFRAAHKTIKAMELGAVDFVQKPDARTSKGIEDVADELISCIRAVTCDAEPRKIPSGPTPISAARFDPTFARPLERMVRQAPSKPPLVVGIGGSTGGIEAIRNVLRLFPADFNGAVLITQHMPSGFTNAFAERLHTAIPMEVKEASHHDVIRAGRALVAPGDYHLQARSDGELGYVELGRQPQVSGHRPSVDVMLETIAEAFGPRCMGIVLTGMGRDGAAGIRSIERAGGVTLAQKESSCVVYGMPKAAVESGAVNHIGTPGQIARWVLRYTGHQGDERPSTADHHKKTNERPATCAGHQKKTNERPATSDEQGAGRQTPAKPKPRI
jgi:two-component system chemotaxis response regulator CheB